MTPIDSSLRDGSVPLASADQPAQLVELSSELLERAQRLRRAARRREAPAELAGMLGCLEAALDSLAVTAAELRVAVLADLAAGERARHEDVVAADVARHFTDLQQALAASAASCGSLRASIAAPRTIR